MKINFNATPTPLQRRGGIQLIIFVVVLAAVAGVALLWNNGVLTNGPNAGQTQNAIVVGDEAPDKIAGAPPTATPTLTPTPLPTATATPLPTLTETPAPTATPIIIVATLPPTPTPENGLREIDNMPLVYVPGGRYLRGSSDADLFSEADEQPQRELLINPFFLDQYEVSMIQYTDFLNAIGDHRRGCGGAECVRVSPDVQGTYLLENEMADGTVIYTVISGFENVPVNHVSWFGAREYCQWVGGRLPTEAEWEYAARGSDNRLYPWGNEEPDRTRAIFATELNRLLAVDSLPAGVSPFGAFGMAGSVWEWVNDWYDAEYYEWGTDDNPTGPSGGEERITRGGSWALDNDASRIRSNNRNFYRPTALRADVGFRCVVDVEQVVENAG